MNESAHDIHRKHTRPFWCEVTERQRRIPQVRVLLFLSTTRSLQNTPLCSKRLQKCGSPEALALKTSPLKQF